MNHERIIIFDFDGVIADTFSAAFAVNQMLVPTMTEKDYRSRFDGNINETRRARDKNPDLIGAFFREFTPRLMGCRVFPGIPNAIRTLGERYALAIVSSSLTEPIREFLATHELDRYFEKILGNDIAESKVQKMKSLLDDFSLTNSRSLMVTDTLGDIREAAQLGIKSLAVTWGFQDKETLLQGNPLLFVENPSDIVPAVQNFFQSHIVR